MSKLLLSRRPCLAKLVRRDQQQKDYFGSSEKAQRSRI